jgi:hypothetical protein
MITTLDKKRVIAIGTRHRASCLLEQYGYTMGLARREGLAMEEILPLGYLDEVDACADYMDARRKNTAWEETETDAALRAAREWRQAVVCFGRFARRSGARLPEGLIKPGRAAAPAACAQELQCLIALLDERSEEFPGSTLPSFLAEGRLLYEWLALLASGRQKRPRLTEEARELQYAKGLLYIGVRGITDMGRVLHRGDAVGAAQYHMFLLHRRTKDRMISPN